MNTLLCSLQATHDRVFGFLERSTDGWLLEFLARAAFAAVLLVYYLNSAATKIGDGITGFFNIGDNAYFQILPGIVEAYDYDVSQIPFFPYDLIVFAGTYAEFLLPILIVLGLFTRLAALGMIGFVMVQSYVDIAFHQVGATTVGAWFDRFSDAAILDQRTLWIFLLIVLVLRGGGLLSIDSVARRYISR